MTTKPSVPLEEQIAWLSLAQSSYTASIDMQNDGARKFLAAIAESLSRVKELEADAQRLDWLGQFRDGFYNIDRISATRLTGFNGCRCLRAAIDAARVSEGAKNE